MIHTFRLPCPPVSDNHLYPDRYGVRHLDHRAKEYRNLVAQTVKYDGTPRVSYDAEGAYRVSIIYYWADHRRRDVSNWNKVILDAMQGVVYKDDKQITDLKLKKRPTDKGESFLLMEVEKL